jgi:hypothetical protein
MFQTSTIQLSDRASTERMEVRSRSVTPDYETKMPPFDVVEVRCFASGGVDFSKLEIFVKGGRGPALAEALEKAMK